MEARKTGLVGWLMAHGWGTGTYAAADRANVLILVSCIVAFFAVLIGVLVLYLGTPASMR